MEYMNKRGHKRFGTDMENIKENLFLVGYASLLCLTVWSTTMLPLNGIASKACKLLFIGLVGIKIMCFDSYSIKDIILIVIMGVCAGAAFICSGYFEVLIWVLLLAGSKDIPFEKILKVYVVIASMVMIFAFSAAMLDVIENLRYVTDGRGIRNSFGANYPTAFGAHIFFIVLTFFYLKGENLRTYHFYITFLIGILIQFFCSARSDAGCIMMISIIFGIGSKVKSAQWGGYRIRKIWDDTWKNYGRYVMVLIAGICIFTTVIYNSVNAIWKNLDSTLEARLRLGKKGLEEYGIKIFGQRIDMVGYGGTTTAPENYFYLDSSYINILLLWGVILFLMVILLYFYISKKNQSDLYFQYAIALIALASVMEPNLMDFGYNPFPMALWALMLKKNRDYNKNTLYKKG